MSDKKYKCEFEGCSKEFKKQDHLKNHKLTHTGERPYVCNYEGCEKRFSVKHNFTVHLRTHTGEKPYECTFDGCNKNFINSTSLKEHNKIHTGEKPHKCIFDGCDKEFSKLGNLKTHIRIHTSTKPYKCNYENCDKSFSDPTALKAHLRVHTGEKPYKCDFDECGKSFSQSCQLKRHYRLHTGEKPYKCNYENCGIDFSDPTSLRDHIKTWHTEEGQQRKKKSEEYTAKLLEKEGVDFKREHQVSFSCNGGTFCRIDYLYINKGVIFAIENDEHQHEGYPLSCETKRMVDVKSVFVQDGNDLPLVWIRYNPDKFSKGENKGKINKKDRVKKIVKLMGEMSGELPPLSIYYCYYDTNKDGSLCIFDDPDFPDELKSITSYIN